MFTTLVQYYTFHLQEVKAIEWFNDSIQCEVSPSASAYDSLIVMYAKLSRPADALSFIQRLKGLYIPQCTSFMVTAEAFIRANNPAGAATIIALAREAKFSGDIITYHSMIYKFLELNQADQAANVLRSYAQDGFVCELNTANSVVGGLIELGTQVASELAVDILSKPNKYGIPSSVRATLL